MARYIFADSFDLGAGRGARGGAISIIPVVFDEVLLGGRGRGIGVKKGVVGLPFELRGYE